MLTGRVLENRARRPVVLSLVRPLVIVKRKPAADPSTRFGNRSVGLDVHLLIFQAPPQPFDEDVLQKATLSVHADPDAPARKLVGERGAGELYALISIENFPPAVSIHRLPQRLDAEIRFPPRAAGAGYYETAHHRQLLRDVKQAVYAGFLVAKTGVVGAGKTTTLRRLHKTLTKESRVILSRSIAVEKARVTIGTLITALTAI
jgi:ABC-type glutathione transport system ATPase component